MSSRSIPAPYTLPIGRLIGVATVVLVALLAAKSASAAPITLSSSVNQSGFNGNTTGSNQLTNTPWDFAGQQYNLLTTITSITVTLTVTDGDTDLGEFDEGHWSLGLDSIDTGLKLNGFTGGAQIVTLTLTSPGAFASVLAALQSDGLLNGTIIDDTPGDNTTAFPSRIQASLDISGTISDTSGGGANNVPLPAAVLMAPAAAAIAGWRARRMKVAK